ncbi:MAG: PDZ domain-containing protein [Bacteroidota bacterium]
MQDVNTRPFLSALGMILLFCFGAFSVAQAQEKSNKKIIIKHKIVTEDGNVTVTEKVIDGDEDEIVIIEEIENLNPSIRIESGDLGVENEVIIIRDGEADLFVPGNSFLAKRRNAFFADPDPGLNNLTVITLQEGEEIPEEVQAQIVEMGLDIETVKAQLAGAERLIRITQFDDNPATIEIDGPENEFEKVDNLFFFEKGKNFNFNFDNELDVDQDIRLFENDYDIEIEDGVFFKREGDNEVNFFFNDDNEHNLFNIRPEGADNDVFWFKKDCENKAQLGVYIENTDKEGVTISDIIPESAAEMAGLQAGDRITQINGKAVSDIGGLTNEIQNHKVGDNINITFVREGNTQTVAAALQAQRVEMNRVPKWNFDRDFNWEFKSYSEDCEALCKAPFLGVYITDSWSEETENGVRITGIFEGTEAERLGLQEDDLILSIDGQSVKSTTEIINIIREHQPGDQIQLTYQQNNQTQTVQATVGRKADAKKYRNCDCENLETVEREAPSKTEIIIIKQPVEASIDPTVEDEQAGASLFENEAPTPLFNNQLQLDDFQLFPNPNNGQFTISFNSVSNAQITVTVVDATGKELFRDQIQNFDGNYFNRLDLSNQAPGFYFVNVVQEGKVFFEKFAISNGK